MKTLKLFFCIALIGFGAVSPFAAQETVKTSLSIDSNIPKSEVYLNGMFQGVTPLTISPIEPGIWMLTVKKDGYYSSSYTIKIAAGDQLSLAVDLKPITGILKIEKAPANAEFIVDEKTYTDTRLVLTEGMHNVTVRAFGFTEKKENVSIDRNKEQILDGKLETAAFAISALRPLKKGFNPDNPSNLGKIEITFDVTAPGNGTIRFLDASGQPVYEIPVGPFSTWKQTIRWNGGDSAGQPVPDGIYSIILSGQGTETELESEVRVDRSIIYPAAESYPGIGASGPVISGILMPKDGALIHFDMLYLPGIVSPGISALIGFTDFLEGGAQSSLLIGGNSQISMDFSGGLKAGTTRGNLHSALSLRYAAGPSTVSKNGSVFRKGIAFGPALEYRLSHFSIGGNSELAWGNDEGLFSKPYLTLSAGLAFRYTLGIFSAALWGYTENLDCIDAGLSAQLLLPETNLLFSAQAGYLMKFSSKDSFFVRGGFGLLL